MRKVGASANGMMKTLLAAVLLLAGASSARADQSVISAPLPWGQVGNTVSLNVTDTTGRTQLGWVGVVASNLAPPSVRVCNTLTKTAYVVLGDSSVVATASTGFPVAAGACNLMTPAIGTMMYWG